MATVVGGIDRQHEARGSSRRHSGATLGTITGPKSEPLMPMLTTVPIRFQLPGPPAAAQAVGEPIASSMACTSVTTSWPSTRVRRLASRSAVCNTARSSEVLICTPANIWSRLPRWAVQIDQQRQRLAGDAVSMVIADADGELPAATRPSAKNWRRWVFPI